MLQTPSRSKECFSVAFRCLSVVSIYDSPNAALSQRGFSTKRRNRLLVNNIDLRSHEKVHVAYDSWFPWRHESWLCFGSGGLSFLLRVAATIISKCSVKMGIIVYYRYGLWLKIWSKDDSYNFKSVVYLHFKKNLEKRGM